MCYLGNEKDPSNANTDENYVHQNLSDLGVGVEDPSNEFREGAEYVHKKQHMPVQKPANLRATCA